MADKFYVKWLSKIKWTNFIDLIIIQQVNLRSMFGLDKREVAIVACEQVNILN